MFVAMMMRSVDSILWYFFEAIISGEFAWDLEKKICVFSAHAEDLEHKSSSTLVSYFLL